MKNTSLSNCTRVKNVVQKQLNHALNLAPNFNEFRPPAARERDASDRIVRVRLWLAAVDTAAFKGQPHQAPLGRPARHLVAPFIVPLGGFFVRPVRCIAGRNPSNVFFLTHAALPILGRSFTGASGCFFFVCGVRVPFAFRIRSITHTSSRMWP